MKSIKGEMNSVVHLFRSLIDDGLKRVSLNISLPVQAYLRDLLIFYIPSERLFQTDLESGRKNLHTLAETYLKAQESPSRERLQYLRQVGDQSLYMSGFFREFLDQKLVNVNYYMNLGRRAYNHLANHHPQEEIFQELSYCFLDLMDVLSYIAKKNSIRTSEDLVKLCDHYLKTGSKVSKYQLEDHGLSIPKTNSSH